MADGIFVIMDDCTEVLSKQSHANIRMMYKQKFFQTNIGAIVKVCFWPWINNVDQHFIHIQGYKESDDTKHGIYLIAVSHLLTTVPKQVLLTELPLLIPMLLEVSLEYI